MSQSSGSTASAASSAASSSADSKIRPRRICEVKTATPRIAPYDPATNWDAWRFAFEMAIKMKAATDGKEVKDDVQALMLLTSIGPEVLNDLIWWTSPQRPSDKTIAELWRILDAQYGKRTEIQLARLQLFEQSQGCRDLRTYFRDLNKLLGRCSFEKMTDVRAAMGAVAFIKGIADPYVRERLLDPANDAKTGEELLAAAEIASSAKRATNFALTTDRGTMKTEAEPPKSRCATCKRSNHETMNWFQNATCTRCQKKGHTAARGKRSRQSDIGESKPPDQTIQTIYQSPFDEEADDDIWRPAY
uniref:Retrotrans_gag domain-containing protein n=1 Tax=Panagrellus redivivus TaxID=6233 RepID=A0A7E4W2X8_PANRE